MDTRILLEAVGYLGSILVAISLMMKSLLRLRLINLVGASVFTLYGILIGAVPVVLLNGLIVGIDIYYLYQMWRQKDYFSLLEVNPEGAYLQQFLTYYAADINQFLPGFNHNPTQKDTALFILRNMVPAGLLLFTTEGETATVRIDFVIPGYRDFKIGNFLYEENAVFFANRDIRQVVSSPGNAVHQTYLRRMGFIQQENGLFTRSIRA